MPHGIKCRRLPRVSGPKLIRIIAPTTHRKDKHKCKFIIH